MRKYDSRTFLRSLLSMGPRLFRVGAFVLVAVLLFNLWVFRQVMAEADTVLLGLGAELMRFPGAAHGDVRDVHFNGATMKVLSGTSRASLEDVLDHYAAKCVEGNSFGSFLRSELKTLGAEDSEELDAPGAWDGVLRFDDGKSGYVACVARGEEHDAGYEGLAKRVQGFLDSNDLSKLGQMRYLFAQHYEDQGQEETFLLNIWSDSSLNIKSMFPQEGDAAGADIPGIPRPKFSRRIFSIKEANEPYAVVSYHAARSADLVESTYLSRVANAGWDQVDVSEGEKVDDNTYIFSKGDATLLVLLAPAENDSTLISLQLAR